MAVPSPVTRQDRRSLRAALRARRREIARREPAALSCPATLRAVLDRAGTVALFIPIMDEIDPWPLVGPSDATVVPLTGAADRSMRFVRWTRGQPTRQSSWGGLEPVEDADHVVPDVIFVPLLGFDSAFNRIGQGGGYYDRYLGAHSGARRIGVAWEGQRVEEGIEAEPWDIPLDAILTERDFYIRNLNR